MIGGQQGNSLLELIKQGKLHAKKPPPAKKEDKAAISSRPVSAGPTTEVCCKDLMRDMYATHMQKKGTFVSLHLHHACFFCSHYFAGIPSIFALG